MRFDRNIHRFESCRPFMEMFEKRGLLDAYKYAENGGQALHVYKAMTAQFPDAPRCFKNSREWGHLLDQDEDRLRDTARKLGVKRIVVGKRGTKRQHVDLCGGPLRKAIKMCEE